MENQDCGAAPSFRSACASCMRPFARDMQPNWQKLDSFGASICGGALPRSSGASATDWNPHHRHSIAAGQKTSGRWLSPHESTDRSHTSRLSVMKPLRTGLILPTASLRRNKDTSKQDRGYRAAGTDERRSRRIARPALALGVAFSARGSFD